ncbi:hypothetical protein [Rhizobium sp. 18065]|uniref:hypothetical protein n=1 Tax=Rhizobium sp. 18065 TaxID=2681411 RepID=UPI00135A1B59|nr:hypothetical protein [Rhizobium sp. 18065]
MDNTETRPASVSRRTVLALGALVPLATVHMPAHAVNSRRAEMLEQAPQSLADYRAFLLRELGEIERKYGSEQFHANSNADARGAFMQSGSRIEQRAAWMAAYADSRPSINATAQPMISRKSDQTTPLSSAG